MIETFTKEEFENQLPKNFIELGLVNGEYTYLIPVMGEVAIMVRSSVSARGVAAQVGEDSIRAWLVDSRQRPIGVKVNAYTTRVPGWGDRMNVMFRTLAAWHLRAGDCPDCGKPMRIFRAGPKAKNPGLMYAKCFDHGHWTSIDGDVTEDEIQTIENIFNGNEKKLDLNNLFEENVVVSPSEFLIIETDKSPTDEQMDAIVSGIDENVRVIAAPGSGKTFTMIERYIYLVEHGVNPDNILVVTFSKNMATEMYKKIVARIPELAKTNAVKQICTIHAICYRMLLEEGDERSVSHSKNGKKETASRKSKIIADNLAEKLWPNIDNRPAGKEIVSWIDTAKMYGFTSAHDYQFFVDACGEYHGSKLHNARRMYDKEMGSAGFLDFADMPFDVEQKLIRDANFRNKYQARFQHVIVDEAQDTSPQALNILMTLSFEPGRNDIYRRL